MTAYRQSITVEEVAADPANAYYVSVHGDVAIEKLSIHGTWIKVQYVNGGSSAGTPKHWGSYVRITELPDHLELYVLSMAALNGETVCQGHADVCKLLGHGKNIVDGVEQGTCPRCGELNGKE